MVTEPLGKFSPLLYSIRICNSKCNNNNNNNNADDVIYLHIFALTQQQKPITESASIQK
jgi:hypothetical protein